MPPTKEEVRAAILALAAEFRAMGGTATTAYDADELVSEADACPECGENRMDWLPWDEAGDYVKCASCSYTYRPGCDDIPAKAV